MTMWFCSWFCLYDALYLLICMIWTTLASLEWNQLDHDIWTLWCVVQFSLQVFH
jgi:hypothetical protein